MADARNHQKLKNIDGKNKKKIGNRENYVTLIKLAQNNLLSDI